MGKIESEGFVKREEAVLALSVEINKMILDYERENGVTLTCSSAMGRQFPEAYPDEPKIQLFSTV